jgi:hypothetical protein
MRHPAGQRRQEGMPCEWCLLMQDSKNSGGADEQPVVAGAEDIDRLLEEAQSLAADISAEAGATRDPDLAEGAGGGEPASSADVMAAEASVEKTLADLETTLSDSQPDRAESGAEGEASTSSAGRPPSERTQSSPAPRGVNMIMDAESEEELVREIAADEAAGAKPDSVAPQGSGAAPGTKPEESGADDRRSGAIWSLGRGLLRAVKMPPRAVMLLLVILDWPFAGFSRTTKQYIGYAAIVTILAAIASFILPSLLQHNPYLSVEH